MMCATLRAPLLCLSLLSLRLVPLLLRLMLPPLMSLSLRLIAQIPVRRHRHRRKASKIRPTISANYHHATSGFKDIKGESWWWGWRSQSIAIDAAASVVDQAW